MGGLNLAESRLRDLGVGVVTRDELQRLNRELYMEIGARDQMIADLQKQIADLEKLKQPAREMQLQDKQRDEIGQSLMERVLQDRVEIVMFDEIAGTDVIHNEIFAFNPQTGRNERFSLNIDAVYYVRDQSPI